MSKTKIYLGVFLIFLFGALVGALGTDLYIEQKISRFKTRDPLKREQAYLKLLTKRLGLTERQQMEIGRIMEESRYEMLGLKEKYEPQLEAVHNRRLDRIEERLNDTQKDEWKKIRMKYSKRFKDRGIEKARPRPQS